jgi:hypothetical protein
MPCSRGLASPPRWIRARLGARSVRDRAAVRHRPDDRVRGAAAGPRCAAAGIAQPPRIRAAIENVLADGALGVKLHVDSRWPVETAAVIAEVTSWAPGWHCAAAPRPLAVISRDCARPSSSSTIGWRRSPIEQQLPRELDEPAARHGKRSVRCAARRTWWSASPILPRSTASSPIAKTVARVVPVAGAGKDGSRNTHDRRPCQTRSDRHHPS